MIYLPPCRSPPPRSPPPPHYRRSRSPFSPRYYRGGDRGGHSQSPGPPHRHYSRSPPPSRTPPPKGPRTPPGPSGQGEGAGPATGDQPGGGQEGQQPQQRSRSPRSPRSRSRSATPPMPGKRRLPPPDPRDTNEKGPGIIYDETAATTQVREDTQCVDEKEIQCDHSALTLGLVDFFGLFLSLPHSASVKPP